MNVSDILSELNDHGFDDIGTPREISFLQETIWDLEAREPWPFLEKVATIHFDGTNPYPTDMPSDYKSLLGLRDTVQGKWLKWIRQDEFEQRVGSEDATYGNPIYFYFIGSQLNVWPIPSAGQSLRLTYLCVSNAITASSLETDILIPARHHRVLVWGTLWKLYEMSDDPETATRFEQHYENGIQQMRNDVWKRQYARADSIAIIDEEWYEVHPGWW